MSTTDINGMVFYTTADGIEPIQNVFNAVSTAVTNAFNSSVRTFKVENQAARDALAITRVPTSSSPLRVYRQDTKTCEINYGPGWVKDGTIISGTTTATFGSGSYIGQFLDDPAGTLYRWDGTAWQSVYMSPLSATFVVGALWNVSGTPSIYRRGLEWQASITLTQKNAGAISAGWTTMGTISAEARLAGGGIIYGSAKVSAPEGPAIASIDRGSGVVQVHMPSFTGTTSTTFLIALQWPAV